MRRQLWWVLGLVLVVTGVVLAVVTRQDRADFGWFAYTPLSESPDWYMGSPGGGGLWVVSRGQVVGLVVAAAGMLVLAGGAGYALARRRARP